MSKSFYILFFFCVSFFSCTESQTGYLPESIGRIDEVLVLMEENNWNGKLGEAFLENFASPYLVLPQAEPLFSIKQKTKSQFNRLLQKYRNIIIVSSLEEQNDIAELMKDVLGKENTEKVKGGSSTFYVIRKNVWAEPQLVLLIFAPAQNELVERLNSHSGELINEIYSSEKKIVEQKLFAYGKNEPVTKRIASKFSIDFSVPKEYELAAETDNFMWLRKETDDLSSSIMIYVQQYSDSVDLNERWKFRNEAGKQFISSRAEGSFMTSDTLIPVIQKNFLINGNNTVESRGLWRMKKDFMGGPFINYVIQDKHNKRIIMLDGFVYAPKLKKREHIRRLEVLFSLVSI